jgi:hypothetical protein
LYALKTTISTKHCTQAEDLSLFERKILSQNDDLINPLKPKRERVRKDSRRVEVTRKHRGGGGERRFIPEGGRKCILLEGTQAIPARRSDKDRMKVKMLGWWVVKVSDRDGRIWFHD